MSDDWLEREEHEVGTRNLIICREARREGTDPDAPYTLYGVRSEFRPRYELPTSWAEPVWVYVEYFGEPGDYEVWFDLVRFEPGDPDDEAEEIEETSYGPYVLRLVGGPFVQGRSYCLRRLPLKATGVHELRLSITDAPGATIATRYLVKE